LGIVYKEGIYTKYSYTTSCLINKIDFLEIYYTARDIAITLSNIQSAWIKSGYLIRELDLLNPKVVLAKLLNRDVIANVNPLALSSALVLIPKDAIIGFSSRPPSCL